MREGKRRGRYVVYERGLLRPCAGGDWSRAVVRLERRPRRGAGDARRRARVRPPGLRVQRREERGPGPDGGRGLGAAVTATGPAPRGAALRARKGPSARSARDAGLALAARPGNAPSGSPSPAAPLTPPTAHERLHSIACSWPRSFRRIARRRLSLRAPERSLRVAFGSPPLTIPMGWQDMDSVARNHLAALSGGAAHRSLRLAPAGRWTARYGSLPSEKKGRRPRTWRSAPRDDLLT